jgi:hypothetical protein
MSSTRNRLTTVAGWVTAALAVALISLGLVLLVLGAGLRQTAGLSVVAIFPALISVACLVPNHRTLALRIVGGVMCVGTLALLVGQLIAPDVEIGRTGRGVLVAICAASGLMTFRGRWPSAEPIDSQSGGKRNPSMPAPNRAKVASGRTTG